VSALLGRAFHLCCITCGTYTLTEDTLVCQDIYGHGKNVSKSSAYAALVHRVPNTFTIVSKKEHAWRRRVLSQGFSNAMMRVMEAKILNYMKKLCQFMIEDDLAVGNGSWTSPKNMSDWCRYLSILRNVRRLSCRQALISVSTSWLKSSLVRSIICSVIR
jgi:hypothetical protein